MTHSVPVSLSTRRQATSQARVKWSYSAKPANLSQASSTASTRVMVGAPELVLELQVVGRVGKDQVDRLFGQGGEHLQAVALQDAVEGQGVHSG